MYAGGWSGLVWRENTAREIEREKVGYNSTKYVCNNSKRTSHDSFIKIIKIYSFQMFSMWVVEMLLGMKMIMKTTELD